jgi:hypothetical protein
MAEDETTEVEENEQDGGSGTTGGGGARTAVKAAAAAAATGAAAMAVRKALSSSNGKSKNGDASSKAERSQKSGKPGSLLTSVASGGWEAARDAVLPLAEDAAGAAGTYLAKNGPDVVRDKIVPKFISSFNEARERD